MALSVVAVLPVLYFLLATVTASPSSRVSRQLRTCPGFPGYCSESYVGDTCLVVCARGRNNVPECQADGTWTDVPRCIEHEPGKDEQVPGVCPGVPGYCSLDTEGGLCTFQCSVGPAIRSSCTADGTWEPYPTCVGDLRETQDGCNPCPGPLGGFRNRTAEAGGGGGRANASGNTRNQGNARGGQGNSRNQVSSRSQGGQRNQANSRGQSNFRSQANQRRPPTHSRNQGNSRGQGGGSRNARPQANNARNQQSARGHGSSRNQVNSRGRTKPNNNKNKSFNKNRNGGGGQQPARHNSGFSSRSGGNGGRSSGGGAAAARKKSAGSCPGSVLQDCINVCPGFSARVFSACVNGCAKRCPGRK